MSEQAGVNNLPWPGQMTSSVPLYNDQPHTPQPGSYGFGMDPNPAFTAAINRLAAAIEKLAESKGL